VHEEQHSSNIAGRDKRGQACYATRSRSRAESEADKNRKEEVKSRISLLNKSLTHCDTTVFFFSSFRATGDLQGTPNGD